MKFADASCLLALLNPDDEFHESATALSGALDAFCLGPGEVMREGYQPPLTSIPHEKTRVSGSRVVCKLHFREKLGEKRRTIRCKAYA